MAVLGRVYIAASENGAEREFRTPYEAMMQASRMVGEVDLYTEQDGNRLHLGHRNTEGEWTETDVA